MYNIILYYFDFDVANDVFRFKLRYNDMLWYRRIDDIVHLLNLYSGELYYDYSIHLRQHLLLQRITESEKY